MNNMLSKEAVGLREDRLLTMLERLLELPTNDVNSTLYQTTQLVAEVLAADKVEAFLHDTATDALVASDVHDMPMELRQDATGIDQLLLVNGGRVFWGFFVGGSPLQGQANIGKCVGGW